MHIYVKYEGSMIKHTGRIRNYRENGCHFKNVGHIDLMRIPEAYVHVIVRYEVSVIKPVAGKTVHRQCQ